MKPELSSPERQRPGNGDHRDLLFKNCRAIFADRIESRLDLKVSCGRIASIGRNLSSEAGDEIIDLSGAYLAPGFIDIHIHGAMGSDTMDATFDAFETICRYHASGGTTSLLLTTVAAEFPRLTEVLRAARAFRSTDYEGARLLGIHLEGPYFSTCKPGAHRPELIRLPVEADYEPLLEWANGPDRILRQMTLAPELPGALRLISLLCAAGVRVSGGHSDAWDEEAAAGFLHGMKGVTHTFNCMSGMRRRGPYRVAGLLEFALSEPGILCELIGDGRHVSSTLMRMLYRAKGPDGICLVTDACAGAGLPKGSKFHSAGLECVVDDGVSMTVDGRGLAGSTSTMIHLIRTLVSQAGVPLAEAIRMATLNPARAMNLPKKGILVEGADADLVVLNESLEVDATYVQGLAS